MGTARRRPQATGSCAQQPAEQPSMVGDPAIGRLDQGPHGFPPDQAADRSERRDLVHDQEPRGSAGRPATLIVAHMDDVKQALYRRRVGHSLGRTLEGHDPQRVVPVEAMQDHGGASAEATVGVEQHRQPWAGRCRDRDLRRYTRYFHVTSIARSVDPDGHEARSA